MRDQRRVFIRNPDSNSPCYRNLCWIHFLGLVVELDEDRTADGRGCGKISAVGLDIEILVGARLVSDVDAVYFFFSLCLLK